MNSAAGTNGAGGAEVAPLIELRDVVFSYAGHTVVDGVSLQVDRGELVALLGPNGCGKTTIMRLINGLELADAGHTCLTGVWSMRHISRIPDGPAFHQRVGFVFRMPTPSCSALRWRRKLLWSRADGAAGRRARPSRARCHGAVSSCRPGRCPPYQLSGGQKKRVALAAVVSMNPDILVLDEPTNGLDEDSCDIVVNFLLAYVAAGKTVLMSTHHQDLVRRLGARAIYIDRYHHVVEAPSPSYGTESGATD
ncbi:MAG: energy-coupling factor ABC transporter ATP-binding protein [Collinsella sp.]